MSLLLWIILIVYLVKGIDILVMMNTDFAKRNWFWLYPAVFTYIGIAVLFALFILGRFN